MLIGFGKCNLKKYLFLTVPIIKLLRELLYFTDYYKINNILFQYLFLYVSKFSNVIFWFILTKKINFPKKLNEKKNEDINGINQIVEEKEKDIEENKKIAIRNSSKGLSQKEINIYEKEKEKKKNKFRKIVILIISSIIDFISNSFYLYTNAFDSNIILNDKLDSKQNSTFYEILETNNNTENKTQTNYNIDDIIFKLIPFRICIRIILIYIFSLLILYQDNIHKHQSTSLLLILAFIIFIQFLLNIDLYYEFLFSLLICFFQEFFYSLDNVIGAKYLSISNGNVYKLLFYNGLLGIIIMFILNLLNGFIHCTDLKMDSKLCRNNNLKTLFDIKKDLLHYLLYCINQILSIIEMACTWLLIFYQSVNHLSVACAIHLFFRFLIKGESNIFHIIIIIICFIFIIFMSLIFNEIIILRFCELDKNTTEEIEKRAIEDNIIIERFSIDNSSEIDSED